jgi:hypothetical protein
MSPDDDRRPPDEADLLPAEEEAAVARLLADAAGPVPMPTEVADRLDSVLAGLVAERAEAERAEAARVVSDRVDAGGVKPVSVADSVRPADELASRRRARWPRLVLAAAAVVIGGYGVTSTLGSGGLAGGAGGDAATTADEGMAASDGDAGGAAESSELPRGRLRSDALQEPLAPGLLARGPVQLRPDRLEEDVRRLLVGSPGTGAPANDRAG